MEYLEKNHPEMLSSILKVGATTATPTTKETLRQSDSTDPYTSRFDKILIAFLDLEALSKIAEFISQLKLTKVSRTPIRLTGGTHNTSNAYWYLRLGIHSILCSS